MFDVLRDNWTLLLIGQYPHGPIGGIVVTILLSLSALVIAIPLGILVALTRISHFKVLRAPATALVYTVRGVPLLMVIFWVYFLVPVLTGYPVTGFVTMLCALVIYDSAYLGDHSCRYRSLAEGADRGVKSAGDELPEDHARGDPAAGAL
jgi:polar amino acid transport system permease protein